MRCDSCGFISFRFNKKCPSCNATIRQSKASLANEPALSIFAASGTLAEDSAVEQDGVGALEDDLRGDGFSDNVNVDLPEAKNADFDLDLSDIKSFNLDLSDAQADSGSVATEPEAPEAVPEISVASVADEEVDMQFDVEPGADGLGDLQADDIDFDFNAEPESSEAAIDGSNEVKLNLDEPAGIAADFDLESGDDAVPSLDLDSEVSFEPESDSLDLDLAMDDSAEPSLDLDLAMDDSAEPSLDLDLTMDEPAEPSLDPDSDPSPKK